MDKCEYCNKREGHWYLINDNMEMKLCAKCAKEIQPECDVERIK